MIIEEYIKIIYNSIAVNYEIIKNAYSSLWKKRSETDLENVHKKIKEDYVSLIDSLESSWRLYCNNKFESRKDSAIFILKNFRVPSIDFLIRR